MNASVIDEIVRFWFEELTPKDWYRKDQALDAEITRRFGGVYDALRSGVPASWLATSKGWLAAIIVLDQFPRNMFRGDPRAFATDAEALALSKRAIAEGVDMQLVPEQRAFLYLPFQHTEDAADQARSVELFTARHPVQSRLCAKAQSHHRPVRALPPPQCRAWPRFDRAGSSLSDTAGVVVLTPSLHRDDRILLETVSPLARLGGGLVAGHA
jgi:uncharacterized protein (DUF924 family)